MYCAVKSFICRENDAEVDINMPAVRDPDSYMYMREWSGGILVGYCEVNGGRACFQDGIPESFEFQLLPDNSDYVRKLKVLFLSGARLTEEFPIGFLWLTHCELCKVDKEVLFGHINKIAKNIGIIIHGYFLILGYF